MPVSKLYHIMYLFHLCILPGFDGPMSEKIKTFFSLLVHTPPSFPLLVFLCWCILSTWYHLLVLTKATEIMRGFKGLLATSASHSCLLLASPTCPRVCPHCFPTPDWVWLLSQVGHVLQHLLLFETASLQRFYHLYLQIAIS